MKHSALALATLLVIVACSKSSKIENHSTLDNNSAIEKLNADSNSTSEKLRASLEKKLDQLNSAANQTARASLFNEMKSADSLPNKVLKASQLFASYDLDSFKDGPSDTQAKLKNTISKELITFLKDVKKNSDNFKAIALAINTNQSLAEAKGDKDKAAQSVYVIVKEALLKEVRAQNLEEFEKNLVTKQNRKLVIDLLERRIESFSELAIESLTDKNARSFWQKLVGSKNYPETFFSSNSSTREIALNYLSSAKETKEYLSDINQKFAIKKSIRKALDKIEMHGESTATDMKARELEAYQREEILTLIEDLTRE